jgi:maltose O-acetyltransferase
MIKFLAGKLKGYSFFLLLRLEFESLLFGILSVIPTTLGVILRAAAAKASFNRCAGMAWIQPRVTIVHGERIRAGSALGINSGTYINGIGRITFGDNVLIGSNVTISSGQHPIDGILPPVFHRQSIPRPISIGNDVWIGAGAVILPGITLADGTVIGANAVVNRDTQPYGIYVGVPARLIRSRLPNSEMSAQSSSKNGAETATQNELDRLC